MTAVKEALIPIYTILGAITFWLIVAAVLLVGSVAVVSWWRGWRNYSRPVRQLRKMSGADTDRLVREWRREIA